MQLIHYCKKVLKIRQFFASKLFLVMKLTILILILACVQVFAKVSAQKINLSVKNAPLTKVLDNIHRQSGYSIFYDKELVRKVTDVSVEIKNAIVETALNEVLKDKPLTWSIVDQTIVIKQKETPKSDVASPIETPPPPIIITGRVTNAKREPLPGVSIFIKGTTNGTIADAGGNFRLQITVNDKTLVFSSVGMKKKEVVIAGRTIINVVMEEEMATLEEVSVISTGYQKIKPEQSTGSISTIQLKDYDSRINTTDFLLGLQNKIPGLLIDNDITFEGNSLFQIRGISTIFGNKQPLIVMDGFPTELTLDKIDPNEIESVTVLKDAAAATIYGSRSSNGVIVIERKKAKAGKVNVTFRTTASFRPKENYDRYRWDKDASNTVINADKIFLANTSSMGWYLMTNPNYSDVYYNTPSAQIMAHWRSSSSPISLAERDKELTELGSYNNTKDYSRLFLRTATTQTYNLGISGGNENALYYITANYINNAASQIKNDYNQFHLSGRTMLKFSKRLSMDLTTDFQKQNVNSVPVPDIHSFYPYEHFQDADGNPLATYSGSYGNSYSNSNLLSKGLLDNLYYPLEEINEVSNKTTTLNDRITANFRYDIGNGFNLNFGGVYEVTRTDQNHLASVNSAEVRQYINRYTVYDAINKRYTSLVPTGAYLRQQTASNESYTLRAQLNYDKKITQDHSLNLIVGSEIRDVLEKSSAESYFGYDDQTLIFQPLDFTVIQAFSPSYARNNKVLSYADLFSIGYSDNRFVSLYSNLVYSYKSKYSLTGSIRIDQSNLFGTDPKYQYKPLWSVGALWNIHKENFMQNMNWAKSIKLRTAYGFNGNVAKNSLPQVIAVSGLTNSLSSSYTLSMLSLLSFANSGLRWEQTNNFNIGMDYELFKGISGSIDYYTKKSTDVLANNKIDATKGGISAIINRASIRNNGFEFKLDADWITTKKFNWNTGLVFAHNGSKVLDVYNTNIASSTTSSYKYVYGSNANYLKGYAVGAIFAYRYAGIDAQGNPLIYDKDGNARKFFTGTDNGVKDVVYMGSSIPTFNLGLSNRVDVGNFYFYCMVNYFGGFKIRVPVPFARDKQPLEGANNYWKVAGDELISDILPAIGNTYYSYLQYTDRYIVNGAYMTLSDLTASYAFRNSKWLKKEGIRCEVRGQASNILTVAFNKYNFSKATGSYEKSYLTPTYTIALSFNF